MSACLSCTKQHWRRRQRRQQRRRRRYSGIHTPRFNVVVCASTFWLPHARAFIAAVMSQMRARLCIRLCDTYMRNIEYVNIDSFFSSLSHFGSFVCRFVNARRRRFALFSMYMCNIYLSGFRFVPALSILSTHPYSRPKERERQKESGVHTENEFRTHQCQCSALASISFVCATSTRLPSCSSPDDFYTNTSKVRVPL